MSTNVVELVRNDVWSIAHGTASIGHVFIRFRTPVLEPSQIGEYQRVLKIVWPYADEDTGALPSHQQDAELAVFEARLCEALETDYLAALTAVLTFDGARQWVFYTFDIPECGRRISSMPHDNGKYPIELTTEPDPEWRYLRTVILGGVQEPR